MDGEARLARCEGIDGAGESASFECPARIISCNSIVIDLSASSSDCQNSLHGTWDYDGIRFSKESNKWHKVPTQRSENLTSFLKLFNDFGHSSMEIAKEEFF